MDVVFGDYAGFGCDGTCNGKMLTPQASQRQPDLLSCEMLIDGSSRGEEVFALAINRIVESDFYYFIHS